MYSRKLRQWPLIRSAVGEVGYQGCLLPTSTLLALTVGPENEHFRGFALSRYTPALASGARCRRSAAIPCRSNERTAAGSTCICSAICSTPNPS